MSSRRNSAASSPCTCIVTEPSAETALPPPPSSRVKSSRSGTSSPSSRLRRRAMADLSATKGSPSPPRIPVPHTTTAPLVVSAEIVVAPSTARHAASAIASTQILSGLSRQPARSRSTASLARALRATTMRATVFRTEVRKTPSALMAPPHTTSTAVPTKTPAPIAPAARVASGIAQPHALQPGQEQQSSHPYVTARHDAEHGKQEGLTSEGVVSVEVRRAQRGKDDEKYDRERHGDRRGRARLHLKSARLALDLLGAADRDFEVGEERRQLAAARALYEDRGGEQIEQRLADPLPCRAPGLAPANRGGGDDPKLRPQRRRTTLAQHGDGSVDSIRTGFQELAQHPHRLQHCVLEQNLLGPRSSGNGAAHNRNRAYGTCESQHRQPGDQGRGKGSNERDRQLDHGEAGSAESWPTCGGDQRDLQCPALAHHSLDPRRSN